MPRIIVNGIDLEYETRCSGEPIVFGHVLPALRQWSFGPERARDLRMPVLAALGEKSDVRFHQRQKLLLEWLPHAEPFILPEAGHLLHLENLTGMAEGLAAFAGRHSSGSEA